MINKCPGQDKRNIRIELIQCANCGYELEIFSDEIKVKCPKCKKLLCREHLPGCTGWCKFAKDCVGREKLK